ncbi:MAG: class I SAM-dependent methyltransferase [Planctomycetota bacterium]|nr:MAG: class I SAM-dependent methyltransferase [Planctomycetota bacterium]
MLVRAYRAVESQVRRVLPHRVIFGRIYRRGGWGAAASRSGAGSTLQQTRRVREALPGLIERLGVVSLLDVPCGDFHWLQHVSLPLERYIGGDVVPELIRANRERFGSRTHEFRVLDITRDPLPQADLVLCRDLLVHFSYRDIRRALENLRRSGSRYLLTTTFPDHPENRDIVTGSWRPIHLEKPPFLFPPPLEVLREGHDDPRFADKSLGLWRIADLPMASV